MLHHDLDILKMHVPEHQQEAKLSTETARDADVGAHSQ